jgi:hypothetical protein
MDATTEAPLIDLHTDDLQQLGAVYSSHNIFAREAVKFGNSLFTYPVIKKRYGDPPQYAKLKADKQLIKFFAGNFCLFLPKTMDGSEYGVFSIVKGGQVFEIAPDFIFAQWDRDRLQAACLNHSLEVFERAYKNLKNLKQNMDRKAKNMIDEFQYQGKPIKPAAEALTPEALKAKNDEKLRKLIVSFSSFPFNQ